MCEWCRNPNADEITPNLCRAHEAEALGTTPDDVERGLSTQNAEYWDTRR